jgi:uncharacterized protein DUF4384
MTMSRSTLILGTILLAAASEASPSLQTPTARDRYYEAALQADSREPAWRAVRTSILLRRGANLHEVGEQADFRNGDSFRLRVESNMDGYLYLFLRDSGGTLRLLFPYEGAQAKANRVAAFESRLVPGKPGSWFRFDDAGGAEQVFLFLSARPIAELEKMKKGTSLETLKELERFIARNGAAESLRFDEGGEDPGATFYAEKNTGTRQFLVRRLKLNHVSE